MKSLFERATPELKKALAVYAVDYPTFTEMIQEDLKTNYWVAQLKFGTIVNLEGAARNAGWKFDTNNPWQYFQTS